MFYFIKDFQQLTDMKDVRTATQNRLTANMRFRFAPPKLAFGKIRISSTLHETP